MAADSPEVRAAAVLAALEEKAGKANDLALLSDHLSLLRRWYYRPEKQRAGEIFLPNADGEWPVRRILRGAARAALGEPKKMAETQREAAKGAKVKILHEGRAGCGAGGCGGGEAVAGVGKVDIERWMLGLARSSQ